MIPSKIFKNLHVDYHVDILFDHVPDKEYSIFCPYCDCTTETIPESPHPEFAVLPDRLTEAVDNFFCNKCKWSARHRLFLKLATEELLNPNIKNVYFPNENQIASRIFEKVKDLRYDANLKIYVSKFQDDVNFDNNEKLNLVTSFQDLTNLTYENNFFDYIVSNHTLEHILNYKQSISELFRVLNKNGSILLNFPIAYTREKTIQVAKVVNNEVIWESNPIYHGGKKFKFPVFNDFGLDIIKEIEDICIGADVSVENYVDNSIGVFNQGYNYIRITK